MSKSLGLQLLSETAELIDACVEDGNLPPQMRDIFIRKLEIAQKLLDEEIESLKRENKVLSESEGI